MHGIDSGALRGGRVLEASGGLHDLATGWPARVVSSIVSATDAEAWRHPSAARAWVTPHAGEVAIDAWLTHDWLGRWRVTQVLARTSGLGAVMLDMPEPAWRPPFVVGITRVSSLEVWCALAAAARRAGVVPITLAWLSRLDVTRARAWPPVLVALGEGADASPVVAWVAHGGHVAGLVEAGSLPLDSPVRVALAGGLPALGPSTSRQARLVRRAWQARARAPLAPSFHWCSDPSEERIRMTHLELLDVTAALEEVRRDEDALVATCRAVRQHALAHRAGILVVKGKEARVLVAEDACPDAVQAWQRLCLDDRSGGLASTTGWHAAGRHATRDDVEVHVCGTWRTRDEAAGRADLLPVFARLASMRMPSVLPATGTSPLADMLVGDSVVMRDVRAQIALAARAPFPVLIRGESGCGKELAARAIHALGARRHRRCAAINCAALPDDLIESELFGHVRGAFTGAAGDRAGLFDEADGGTLFLDEVGELGGRAQAKLLRVLQDGEVRRVGENQARRVDVRVIAATNVSLEDAVRRGTFRADLFYRLDVVRVRMPALRERREDIPLLARHFWQECAARVGSRARLEGPVLDVLAQHDWPGNVRQLQNMLAALAVRVPARGRVGVDDLPPELRCPAGTVPYARRGALGQARREFEATYVRDALSRAGGRPSQAARDLGVTRQGLSKLVRRLGLDELDPGARLP